MAELEDLKAFDIAATAVSVWTFKKSTPTGQPPVFTGRWIAVDDALAAALRQSLTTARAVIGETHPFGLLAQINEGSALVLGMDETHAPGIVAQTADPTPERKVRDLKQIGVSTAPGLKVFTRMPRAFSSCAQVRTSERTPALAAL